MKKLVVLFAIMMSGILLAVTTGCKLGSATFTDTLELTAEKTTLEEASNILGMAVPSPAYLPKDYKIQEVYIQGRTPRLLISDKEIEKKLITHTDAAGTRQRYEFQCTMEMGIKWYPKGQVGDLKLPGDRVTIGASRGVIVDAGDHNALWWLMPTRSTPEQPGQFEITLSASKNIPKAELLKIAESLRY